MNALVSVIMAAYNAELYISEAIESVLTQTHQNFELLVVNDGSADETDKVIRSFEDDRIVYIPLAENQGVSNARNEALAQMKGDFFCFLDGDDVFPKESLQARLTEFEANQALDFVDGRVEYVNENLQPLGHHYLPEFKGQPFNALLRLDRRCLFGNTWMIRRKSGMDYRFEPGMTHAEDLFFYLSIPATGEYSFTSEAILLYRQREGSAMKDFYGLERGYRILLNKIGAMKLVTDEQYRYLKRRITRIMFLSYLRQKKDPVSAAKSLSILLKSRLR